MTEFKWLKAKVIRGNRMGTKIGIPTINLDNPKIMDSFTRGVYGAKVLFGGKIYKGSLYFGPRTINKDQKTVLEIHIFDFNLDLYGTEISFRPLKFVRPPANFHNLAEMKKMIEEDNRKIKSGKI